MFEFFKLPLATWCKIIFQRNSRLNKTKTSLFKKKLLYDTFSQSYISVNYSQFFRVIGTIMLFTIYTFRFVHTCLIPNNC